MRKKTSKLPNENFSVSVPYAPAPLPGQKRRGKKRESDELYFQKAMDRMNDLK